MIRTTFSRDMRRITKKLSCSFYLHEITTMRGRVQDCSNSVFTISYSPLLSVELVVLDPLKGYLLGALGHKPHDVFEKDERPK